MARFWSRSLAELDEAELDTGLPSVMVSDEKGEDVESNDVGSMESRRSWILLVAWFPIGKCHTLGFKFLTLKIKLKYQQQKKYFIHAQTKPPKTHAFFVKNIYQW